MIILGIDPGTATTGFAVIKKPENRDQKPHVIDFGCIFTATSLSAEKRLELIYDQVRALLKKHSPELLSIESIYFFKNLKTAMPVSQARGVILLAAAQQNIPTIEFTPLQVKMTVAGYGKAEKKQVQAMIKNLLDFGNLDINKKTIKKDDATDALGIALCGSLALLT